MKLFEEEKMCEKRREETAFRKIDFKEAKEILDANPDAMILDVREEEEYITGHAINAVLFTLADINAESAEFLIPEKDRPLLVYCRTGRRSGQACRILKDLGYRRIYDIGSLIGWPYGQE